MTTDSAIIGKDKASVEKVASGLSLCVKPAKDRVASVHKKTNLVPRTTYRDSVEQTLLMKFFL